MPLLPIGKQNRLPILSNLPMNSHTKRTYLTVLILIGQAETPVPIEQAKALLSMKYPLDYLYQEWIEYDYSALDMLRDSNNLAIEKAVNHMKSRTDIEVER